MFGMNKNSVENAYNGIINTAAKQGAPVHGSQDRGAQIGNVSYAPEKPSRPGDTPPRAFVGKTLDQLKKTQESYVAERDLLAKDIQKLTEEHSQVIRSLAAISAAISSLEAPEAQVDMQQLEDELTNVGTI